MPQRRWFRDFDWPLMAITLAICSLGVLQIYSATLDRLQGSWWKQATYIGLGIVLMWVVSRIDYHTLLAQVPVMYTASITLLLAVLVIGKRAFGSTRWILLPGNLHLQVSEFAKLVIILLVARYMTERRTGDLDVKELLKIVGLVLLPMLLIMKEPDLGTSLTYLPILAMGVVLAGLPWKYWAAIGVLVLVVLPVGFQFLKPYQRDRLTSFVEPDRDPKGSGYQVIQSKIAVGAGGMWGKGVTKGTQTQLRFLPVGYTDFIFSAFAEEHGFVGVMVVLSMYFLLLLQIVQNAQTAPDRAGVYICMGVAALLLFHLLVNVGMVVGRMPTTGIPLPLMSYGGSSIWSVFLMLGLVNNVRLRRFVN